VYVPHELEVSRHETREIEEVVHEEAILIVRET